MDNKSESIDDLLAMNLSNQTTLNRTVFNYTEFNSSNLNLSDINSSEISPLKISSLEPNSSELNSPESNSSEFNSSEFGSDFNSSELAFKDLDFADNYYDSDFYSQIPNEPEVISLAFPATDLNGDNATDLLVMNISSDADTGAFNSEISAFSGGRRQHFMAKGLSRLPGLCHNRGRPQWRRPNGCHDR